MIIRNEGISMKISAKGRYGLAAMTYLARNYASGSPVTIVSISEKLGISKIYLEQVFSLLKRARPCLLELLEREPAAAASTRPTSAAPPAKTPPAPWRRT